MSINPEVLEAAKRIVDAAEGRGEMPHGVKVQVARALLYAEKERLRLVALYHETNEFAGKQMNRADKAEAELAIVKRAIFPGDSGKWFDLYQQMWDHAKEKGGEFAALKANVAKADSEMSGLIQEATFSPHRVGLEDALSILRRHCPADEESVSPAGRA